MVEPNAELARLLRERFDVVEMRRVAEIYERGEGHRLSHHLPAGSASRAQLASAIVRRLEKTEGRLPPAFLDLLRVLLPEHHASVEAIAEAAGASLGGALWPDARAQLLEVQLAPPEGALAAWKRPFAPLLLRALPSARGPEQRQALRYLRGFIDEMQRQNRSVLAPGRYVDPHARPLEEAPQPGARDAHVPHRLRELIAEQRGGSGASAAMAIAEHPSRFVSDVVQAMLRDPSPCVLLAEPGMGKSMTLRQVGIAIAQANLHAWSPRLPVYLRLAEFRDPDPDALSVLAFVRRQFMRDAALGERFDALLRAGRLVLLFDGMDEMDRQGYAQRVAALSDFAARWQSTCHSLFACRTNDFLRSFRHKQFVLVPFDAQQMREFVRLNLFREHPSITVGGQRYSRRGAAAFVRALQASPMGEEMRTPLFLALTCRYVVHTGQLPEARGALFAWFVGELIHLQQQKPGGAEASPDAVLTAWSELGYALTRASEGTALGEAALLARLQEPRALTWGLQAGLLTKHPGDAEGGAPVYSFVHHRLQEYLAAAWTLEHPAPDDLDWARALDVPRWQEIVLHLAGMSGGEHPAFAALREGARWPYSPSPEEEPLVADRLLLAARVYAVNPAAVNVERLRRGVKAMAAARPPSQAKALEASTAFPETLGEVVDALKDAPIDWVRRHALTLMGQRARELKQDPRLMMGLSLVRDTWSTEFWDFLDVVRQDGLKGWAPALVMASVSWVLGRLAVVGVPIALLLLLATLMPTRETVGAMEGVAGVGGVVLAVGGLVAYPLVRRRLEASAFLAAGVVGAGVGLGAVASTLLFKFPPGIALTVVFALLGLLLALGLASALLCAWIRVGLFVLLTPLYGWSSQDLSSLSQATLDSLGLSELKGTISPLLYAGLLVFLLRLLLVTVFGALGMPQGIGVLASGCLKLEALALGLGVVGVLLVTSNNETDKPKERRRAIIKAYMRELVRDIGAVVVFLPVAAVVLSLGVVLTAVLGEFLLHTFIRLLGLVGASPEAVFGLGVGASVAACLSAVFLYLRRGATYARHAAHEKSSDAYAGPSLPEFIAELTQSLPANITPSEARALLSTYREYEERVKTLTLSQQSLYWGQIRDLEAIERQGRRLTPLDECAEDEAPTG